MAKLPKKTLTQLIDAVEIESYPRPHLGASVIGHPCKRKVAYSFYWAHKIRVGGKLERIFRMGDAVEELIKTHLSTIGVTIDGSQTTVSDPTGHAGGSYDGVATNVPGFEGEALLFEAKSANHTNYLDIRNKGVQAAKMTHYVQMQMYMGRANFQFGLYALYDKNTSDLYFEFIPFDEECYEEHCNIETDVLFMQHINSFPRISTNPSWFQCKICDAKDTCHRGLAPERNCRTCQHSRLGTKGTWACLVNTDEATYLNLEEQEAGCNAFQLADKWI